MHDTPVLVTAALVLGILMAGCTAAQSSATQPAPAASGTQTLPAPSLSQPQALPPDITGTWKLTNMSIRGGTSMTIPSTEITLILNPDGSLSGYDGCNHYFASATLTSPAASGTGLKLGTVGSTKKYCSAVAEQEQQYLNILEKTVSYSVEGSRLTLTATTKDTLVYERSPAS